MPATLSLPDLTSDFVCLCQPGTCLRQPAHHEAKRWSMSFLSVSSEMEDSLLSLMEGSCRSGKRSPGLRSKAVAILVTIARVMIMCRSGAFNMMLFGY